MKAPASLRLICAIAAFLACIAIPTVTPGSAIACVHADADVPLA